MKNPDKIEINKDQADEVIARLQATNLSDSDKSTLITIVQWYFWFQSALLEQKISIKRLMSMFGFKRTESSKNLGVNLDDSFENETAENIRALLASDQNEDLESDKKSSDQSTDQCTTVDTTNIEPSNQNSSENPEGVKKKATVV
jgi:hypothetical protein